jgi:hypothetical protein
MASSTLRRPVRRRIAFRDLQLGAISAQLYEIDPVGSEGSVATFVTIPPFVGTHPAPLGRSSDGTVGAPESDAT